MTIKTQIIEELKKNIKDEEELKVLHSICEEIFKKGNKGSGAVSELLQNEINSLKSKFNDAYDRLLKKIGI